MNRHVFLLAACAALLATAVGCKSHEMKFDRHGWGGPSLEYDRQAKGTTIILRSGMLVNKDFRWAESEFQFEFLDRRDLAWGIRLLDTVFSEGRRKALRDTRVKIGDQTFVLGKDLPPEQLWKFDTVVDVQLRRDKKSRGYKVLDGVWYESFLEDGRTGVRIRAVRDVRVKPNTWNRMRVTVDGGKVSFRINDEPDKGALQVDQRANGRLGIFLEAGGPLLIRNLQLGPPPAAKKAP